MRPERRRVFDDGRANAGTRVRGSSGRGRGSGGVAAVVGGWWLLLLTLDSFVDASKYQAPSFHEEPPSRVRFLNSSGVVIPCAVQGQPPPRISWIHRDGSEALTVPNLRHVRSDGALVLEPFAAQDFRSDVHDTAYRCSAQNPAGAVLSRDVKVTAGMLCVCSTPASAGFASSALILCEGSTPSRKGGPREDEEDLRDVCSDRVCSTEFRGREFGGYVTPGHTVLSHGEWMTLKAQRPPPHDPVG
ncbi:Down syndrome cell adhesion molecule-like [Tropilaelaps mercedesae]|uniref:Down syndrome cell adhesion molecule-like n=1 Tax=Tropilaelaps mercedesae TaxID=418985 RepID=A0A1V9X8V2_9ACAR|nr:Down syndrome cell adhesion molecule-like [Tropilaelaps mercedesae]